MTSAPHIFDRHALRQHRERAARGSEATDGLVTEIAERLAERLDDVRRRFPLALDLGCRHGALTHRLVRHQAIERVFACDLAPGFARKPRCPALAADEEALPFADGAFDLIASNLALHWTNDLPGALVQIRRALKPDGLFLGTLFGGGTLAELRQALINADIDLTGGASSRVSPFADVRDLGMLLQRAGFALPVVDRDVITVTYPDALALMRDLRTMGETNAIAGRRTMLTPRRLIAAAAALYAKTASRPGGIGATFEVVYLTAWAPHASQPKALAPGSAAIRLGAALGTEENPQSGAAGRPQPPTARDR